MKESVIYPYSFLVDIMSPNWFLLFCEFIRFYDLVTGTDKKNPPSKRDDTQRTAGNFTGMMKYLSFQAHVATCYLREGKGMCCERR